MELLSDTGAGCSGRSLGPVASQHSLCPHSPLLWLLIVPWFGASSLTLCPSPSSHPSSHGRPLNLPKGQTCSCKHTLQWLHVACQTDLSAAAETHILPSPAPACLAVHFPPLACGSASAVPQHIFFPNLWAFVHAVSTALKPLHLVSASSNPGSATY